MMEDPDDSSAEIGVDPGGESGKEGGSEPDGAANAIDDDDLVGIFRLGFAGDRFRRARGRAFATWFGFPFEDGLGAHSAKEENSATPGARNPEDEVASGADPAEEQGDRGPEDRSDDEISVSNQSAE